MGASEWQEADRKILDWLNLPTEYALLGLDITGQQSNGSGWLACRAYGQEDRTPSAGINVGSEHPQRGRYKEFTGEGRNLSFFEFAAMTGKFADWRAARKHYAREAGVKTPKERGKSPGDNLLFRQGTKDEDDLLGEIFSSLVDLGHGERANVAQILSTPNSYPGGIDALERVGVVKVASGQGTRADLGSATHLFIANTPVARYLLKGTQWESQAIDQLLQRLPGSRKDQRRVGGHHPRGVMIPLDYIEENYLSKSEPETNGF